MINIKAQIATEYLIVIGIVLLLVVPLTLLYAKYSSESNYALTTAKVDAIANQIIATANQVNVYGRDTQVKLSIDFPDNIKSLELKDNEIIFTIISQENEESQIVKVADTQLEDKLYSTITPGKKNIIVKSLGSSVAIQFACKTSADCNLGEVCLNSICSIS